MATRWKRDLLLGKHLDLVPDHIDSSLVGRVQLQHGLAEVLAQEDTRQAKDCGGLADTGRALEAEDGGDLVRKASNRGRRIYKLTAMIIFGALPCEANTPNRLTVSVLPTISSNFVGRYFSILERETTTIGK